MSTKSITLEHFLKAIFPDDELLPKERICLTRKNANGTWDTFPGTPKRIAKIAQEEPAAWYFGVSTYFAARAPTKFRRNRANSMRAWCLVLDDIGTKAQEPPVEPTWDAQSSKGNYQWGYFIEPIDLTDPAQEAYYEGCQRAFAEAGYTDPGACGTYRVMRVPGSLHRTGFLTEVTWRDDRVWSLPDLMGAMGLKPVMTAPRKPTDPDFVSSLENVDDPVYDWLVENGHATGKTSADFVEVICPWAGEHTSDGDTAGYAPRGYVPEQYEQSFSCFHDHCQGRSRADFLEWAYAQGAPRRVLHDRAPMIEKLPDVPKEPTPDRSLPQNVALTKGQLPDCVWTAKSGPAAAQRATDDNLQYVLDNIDLELRFNHATNIVECGQGDRAGAMLRYEQAFSRFTSELLRLGIANDQRAERHMELTARQNGYHPFDVWMQQLPRWDKRDRLTQLEETIETDTELWPVYLRKWLAQVVHASRAWRSEPRALPHVLVLTGEQGVGKSRWMSRLLPHEFFQGEAQLHLSGHESRDQQAVALSHAIVELGEIDTTFRKSEIGALKAFLSRATDTLRLPYARAAELKNRGTVFCGTVNHLQFLRDNTGSRRFWPVEVTGRIDHEHNINMRQLWSQVRYLVDQGELDLVLTAQEDHQRAIDAGQHEEPTEVRELFDDYFDQDWMEGHERKHLMPVSVMELLRVFGMPPRDVGNPISRGEATRLLRTMTGEKPRTICGKRRAYLLPIKPEHAHMVKVSKRWLEDSSKTG